MRDGTRVRITFLVDEPLSADPELEASGALAALGFDKVPELSTGLLYTMEASVAGLPADTVAESTVRLVDLVDLVGNHLPEPVTLLTVRVDTDAPDAPRVDVPDAVVYRRIPHGSDETGGDPRFALRGVAGAVDLPTFPGEVGTIVAFNVAPHVEIGRGAAGSNGSFDAFTLSPANREVVQLLYLDGAGNPSPEVAVRDIEWVATMGGELAGNDVQNPHAYDRRPWLAGTLFQDEAEPMPGGALVVPGDGLAVEAEGRGDFRTVCEAGHMVPPARRYGAMAYDAARGRVILFGGRRYADAESWGSGDEWYDTWEWDGRGWEQLCGPGTTCEGPEPRMGSAMAYDAARGRVVLFGGFLADGSKITDEIWEWEGRTRTWALVCGGDTGCAGPSGLAWTAMAYDARRGQVVVQGGMTEYGLPPKLSDETWAWRGPEGGWTPICGGGTGCAAPTKRFGHAMAYDTTRDRFVLVGGRTANNVDFRETWELRAEPPQWQMVSGGGPAGRTHPAVVYDAASHETVLFGGASGLNQDNYYGDTWAWNGSTWQERCLDATICAGPAARTGQTAAYDAAREEVVIFGGQSATADFTDTWRFTGGTWGQVGDAATPCLAPEAVFNPAASFDAERGVTVLFGGAVANSVSISQTWEWNGLGWRERCVGADVCGAGVPSARMGSSLGWSPSDGYSVLHGGIETDLCSLRTDYYAWNGELWFRLCFPTSFAPAWCSQSPASRSSAAVTVGPDGEFMLYGGSYTNNPPGGFCIAKQRLDTWRWDGPGWSTLVTDGGIYADPPTSGSGRIAYDSARDALVLFGWQGEEPKRAITLEWSDMAGWETRCDELAGCEGPRGRYAHRMVYDPLRGRTLLYGGLDYSGLANLNRAWEWDGSIWREACGPDLACVAPYRRTSPAMTYDTWRGEVVIFGGWWGGVPTDETWRWNAGGARSPAQVFQARFSHAGDVAPSDVQRVTTRWVARGAGFPDGSETSGVRLSIWDAGAWQEIETAGGTVDAFGELTWSTDDPLRLARLFFGDDLALGIAATSLAPVGFGGPDHSDGLLAVDYAEVVVTYRLP